MNACPNDQAVSTTMSPSGIVEGKLNPDFNRRRIAFGAYAFVFDRTNNKMDSRSTPGIALYESNEEDGFYFMSLATGKRVNARKWVPLPITDDVVARVSELADTQKQGALVNNQPTFEWAPGVSVQDIDLSLDNSEESDADEGNDRPMLLPENPFEMVGVISDEDEDTDGSKEIDLDFDGHMSESAEVIDEGFLMDDTGDNMSRDLETMNEENVNSEDYSYHQDLFENPIEESRSVDPVSDVPTPDEASTEEVPVLTASEDPLDSETVIVTEGVVGRPRRANAGNGVERLEMDFGGKEYASVQSKQLLMKQGKSERARRHTEARSVGQQSTDF